MGSSVSARVREVVLRFDPLAGESVTAFCHRVQVSRSTFYRVRERGRVEGFGPALVPRSRAPLVPARRFGEDTDQVISDLRAELVAEGFEAGPWSIWWRMFRAGLDPVPSRSTIARRLRLLGLAEPSPRKRPRSAWHRFVRTRAKELWQLDGIEWFIDGLRHTIYQVHDDCTRMLVGLWAAPGNETSAGAQHVLQVAFDTFGAPAAVLTDNARAFNQHRFGSHSALETWLADQGIRPISGSFSHPQTQGKVERAHQPLQARLRRRRIRSLEQLNTELVAFAHYYNHERQHQGLGFSITPFMAWNSVAHDAPADRPIPLDQLYGRQPLTLPPPSTRLTRASRRVGGNGRIGWDGHYLYLPSPMHRQTVHLIQTPAHLEIFDTDGVEYARIPWPPPREPREISLAKSPYLSPRNLTRPDPTNPSQKS